MLKQIAFFLIIFQLSAFAEEVNLQATASYEFAFFKMIVTLGILLALVFGSLWLMRRFSQMRLRQSNQNKSIRVVERRSISPKTILYVVEFSGKQILLAESQLEVRKIDEIAEKPITHRD